MSQDPSAITARPTFMRVAVVVTAAVVAALGGGIAIAANVPLPHQATQAATPPSEFVGITPVRVLDTRGPASGGPIGVPAAGKLGPQATIDVAIGGVHGIPSNATAVTLNSTIDEDATKTAFLTVYPTGQSRPGASLNNAEPGIVMANGGTFQLGTGGKLSVFNQNGEVHVIMDVTGYYLTGPTGTTGPPGPGVAAGGTTDQILAKLSDTDFDTGWVDAPAKGGGVVYPMKYAAVGEWMYPTAGGVTANPLLSATQLQAAPIFMWESGRVIDRICVYRDQLSSYEFRVGLYADDGAGRPGALLWDSGTQGVAAGFGLVGFAVPNVVIPTDTVWTAVSTSGSTVWGFGIADITVAARDDGTGLPESTASGVQTPYSFGVALPNPFGTSTQIRLAPYVPLRLGA